MDNQERPEKGIAERQNEPLQLRRLAAQRRLYQAAKRLVAAQVILAVPLPVLWSVAVKVTPWLDVHAALWGLCASLFDALFLDRLQKYFRRRAARVQELFDCDVLALPWNSLVAEERPDPEAVERAAADHQADERTPLRDWYPLSVARLPIYLARLICQRSNLWWDGGVRSTYRNWLVGTLTAVVFIVVYLGVLGDVSLRYFVLAVLAPLSPALLFGAREYRAHTEAIAAVTRFRVYVNRLLGRVREGTLSSDESERQSRRLQDAIFDHRARAPVIFDWIYRRLRFRHQHDMDRAAEQLVADLMADRGR